MIRIQETRYKIEANRSEFDVLKKVLSLASRDEPLTDKLEDWERRTLYWGMPTEDE